MKQNAVKGVAEAQRELVAYRNTHVQDDEMNQIAKRRGIDIPKEKIAAFCKRHRIRKLSLFGSALRDDFRPDSDVDFLVEFKPGHAVGYISLAAMERELSEMLGRKVDLRTAAELSSYFREEVVRSAEVQYGEA